MKQYFNIVEIKTTMDMGVGSRYKKWTCLDEDELTPGAKFMDGGMTVVSIDRKEMVFTFGDRTLRINREWQVLGTPEMDVSNMYVSGEKRYVFHFGNHPDSNHEWKEDEYAPLAEAMMANAEEGDFWKNIPSARQFLHILKDVAPFRNRHVNPAYKAHLISLVLKNDLIQKKETPRLFQSYCELYRLYVDFSDVADFDEELQKEFDKDYFRDVDRWIYNLALIVSAPQQEYAINCWNGLGGLLKVDPVQATQEWEDVIYEVEKEVDEQLKDEPRGMGFCFCYWSAKRAALACRGIEWRSPSAMNPRVMFD